MGTPEFAVPSLRVLVEAGYQVVAVITAPDQAAGRGLKPTESAVKQYAKTQNLLVLQPEKLKNPEFLAMLQSLNADLQVVVAFRMLPEAVWAMPPKGTFKLHASLLPKYRGAAPIHWAVINGETETGATTFFLTHEIDTGDIILQQKMPITPHQTTGETYEILMEIGADLVLKTVQSIEKNTVKTSPQAETIATPAPKIFRPDCAINWQKNLHELHNFVRGMSPYPCAYTTTSDGKTLKIYRSQPHIASHTSDPKTVLIDKKTIKIAVKDGYLEILELQLEGKKRLTAAAFLAGYPQAFALR